MNALFVNACVREGSRTKRLCDAYMRKNWSGPEVDVRERAVYREPPVPLDARGLLERVCVNGITFRYGEDGRPVKLGAARRLVYITTAGGYLPAECSLERYLRELCGLFCIPDMLFIKAEGLDIWGNDPERLLRETVESLPVHFSEKERKT